MFEALLEIFLRLIYGFCYTPPQIKTENDYRIQGHAGPAHRDRSEASVRRDRERKDLKTEYSIGQRNNVSMIKQ